MRGYDDTTYGESMADVYDEWYDDLDDLEVAVATLDTLAAEGLVLELGVGTGRLAVPLAVALEAHGRPRPTVIGLDTSSAMLAALRRKPDGQRVDARLGDMADDLPAGPFSLVFAAYNTFFALHGADRQATAIAKIATRLSSGGRLLIEAFVPPSATATSDTPSSEVTLRSLAADRVVLSVSRSDPDGQRAEGQFVEFTEAGGVRLRPWSIHWATPVQLDAMSAAAGLELEHRWAGLDRSVYDDTATRHVSVYRRP